MSERNYNYIFSKLVKNHNDFVGLCAYGLYKVHKIDYIEKFVKDNGRRPTDDDLKEFNNITQQEHAIAGYKERAENIFATVVENIHNSRIKDILSIEKEAHKQSLQELKPNWKSYCLSGILGNIAFLVFLGFCLSLSKIFQSDIPSQILNWFLNGILGTN